MRGILRDPTFFFRNKAIDKVKMKAPFLIVLVISIIGSGSGYILMKKMSALVPEDIKGFIIIGSALSLISGFFLNFAIWVIKTGLFHILSLSFGGRGNFRKLLELMGYAQFPLVFSSIIVLVILTIYTPPIDIIEMPDPQMIKEVLKNEQAFKLTGILGRFTFFWSLFLSAIAVREVHKISNKKAAASVLIPVILYVGITELVKRWFASGL